MNENEQLIQIAALHPFPWRTVVYPTGVVQMLDAAGVEVPMFTMTKYVEISTQLKVKEVA
jgi:hypothetical protein